MRDRIPLGKLCENKIDTLSVNDNCLIDYIDISSVDNAEKEIVNTQCISSSNAPSRAKQIVKKGDVLVSTVRPNLNAIAIVNIDSPNLLVASTGYCVLRCDEIVTQRYIYYFCQSPYFIEDMVKQATGASYPAVSASIVKNSLVSFRYNKNIVVENLDLIYNLIKKHKQQLQKLDELVKARFVEMFGASGKQVPLKDYVWFQEGPGVRSVDFTTEGTILLTGSNINNNTLSFGHKSDRYISESLSRGKYAHFMCDTGDILVVSSAIEPTKFDKKVVIVNEDKKYCLNTGIIRFKLNEDYLTKQYFREFLKTDYFKNQVISKMRGIAQMHFGPSHLKEMTIILPNSIELQNQFADFVSQVDKQKAQIKSSLEKLETLKKSLMQKYFG